MRNCALVGLYVAFLFLFIHRSSSQPVDYYAKATKHFLDAKNDSALICLDMALSHPVDSTDYNRKAEILLLRSSVLSNLTFFEPAMDNAIQAYDISDKYGMGDIKAKSLLGIGKVHYLMYNDSVAEGYMIRAKELAQCNGYNKELMMIDNALAQLYSVGERNEEAIALATQSLQVAKERRDTLYIIQNLNLFASYYTNLNRWTDPVIPEYQHKTKQYLDEALQLALAQNSAALIQPIYMRYLRYYRVEKDYTEALNYANKIIEMCEPNHYSMLIQVYDHLVSIYAHLGYKEKTVSSHQKFYTLMRQQSDYNLHRSLQEMQVKYDVQGKELEIMRQQVKIKQTQLQRRLLLLVVLFTLMMSAMYYYMYRSRRKRNKELHLINASKDKLFSIISHDLQAPVAAQKMAAEIVIENFDEMDKPQLLKRIQGFHQTTEVQFELLQNLLNWARMQTGQIKYHSTRFSLSGLVKEVSDIYRLPAQNKGIVIRMDVPEDCTALADRSIIHTVLRNLLNNAVKFSHSGGEIVISVTRAGEKTCVTIKDNGVGMSEDQMNTLFDRTGRKHNTTGTGGEKGSGLGLIICREMLELNNSRLEIKSKQGMGTEVVFCLDG